MRGSVSTFRTDINGLRALAVLAVVLYHFGIPAFQGGFVGVDVFFVISGFLMTGIIFGRLDQGRFSLLEFYLERARRIVPALAALCLVLIVAGWFVLPPSDYKSLGMAAASSIGFFSNIFFRSEANYFDVASHEKWLLHTWSLSVEWQFYMLYPLAILLLRKMMNAWWTRNVLLIAAVFSFLLSIYASPRWPGSSFYLLPTRGWEMLTGALVYLAPVTMTKKRRKVLEWCGLSLIAFSIMKLNAGDVWPGWLASMPVAGAALVIMSARNDSLFTGNAAAQFLGNISYSVYLWHWPQVVALHYFGKFNQASWALAGIAGSIVIGYASYVLVETRTRHHGKQERGQQVTYLAPAMLRFLSLAATIGMLSAGIFKFDGILPRVSESVRIADQESKNTNPLGKDCLPSSGLTSPECIIGGNKRDVSVIVIGDSHSDSIVNAVASAIPHSVQGGVLFLGYVSCLTIPGVKFKGQEVNYRCGDFLDKEFAELSTKHLGKPIVVINRTSGYVWGHNEDNLDKFKAPLIYFGELRKSVDAEYLGEFRRRYIGSMCELAKHRPVYVTRPTPEFGIDIPKTLARQIMRTGNAMDITLDMDQYRKRNAFVLNVMEEASEKCGIRLLDPVPYLCPNGKCLGSINGRPLYHDNNHMSEYGNRFLVPMFRKIFD